jgi:hypothetical protein
MERMVIEYMLGVGYIEGRGEFLRGLELENVWGWGDDRSESVLGGR